MAGWETWEIAIMAVAAFIAVNSLVRLMGRRRDALIDDLTRQAEEEARRQAELRRRENKRRIRRKIKSQSAGKK